MRIFSDALYDFLLMQGPCQSCSNVIFDGKLKAYAGRDERAHNLSGPGKTEF